MKQENLGGKVVSGLLWKFSELMAAQLVAFIVSIVLARILEPKDYGAIAITTVFILIANVFVTSGFSNALVQKMDADNVDFSSVFYFNIVFSSLVYLIIFLIAPYVADFYHRPILSPVLRVVAIQVIIAAVNSVQQAYVSKNMLFKRFFFSTAIGTVVSAFVGIGVALSGGGVWALVAQQLCNVTMDTMILWVTVKWRPVWQFDFKRLKRLLRFGWKILVSSMVYTIYDNLKNLIVGKIYASSQLAYYTKGKQFPQMLVNNVNTSLSSVLFPSMSLLQDDIEGLRESARKSIMVSSFVLFPMMTLLFVMSEDVVVLLLTEKWRSCALYVQVACIYMSTYPIETANVQAINALGRSDYSLILEASKRALGILLLLAVMHHSVFLIACSDIVLSLFSIIVDSIPNKKLLHYSFFAQVRDFLPNLFRSLLMAAAVMGMQILLKEVQLPLLVKILVEGVSGTLVFLLIAIVTRAKEWSMLWGKCKEFLHKRKEHSLPVDEQ